ncbi:MAG: hypothetical protein P8181_07715 [bacterium]
MTRTTMRLALGLMLLWMTGLMACESDVTSSQLNKFPAEDTFSYEVAREARTHFQLESVNGKIELTGSPDSNAIVVSGVRRVESHSVADATARLEGLTVEIDSTDTAVNVRTEQPVDTEGRNYIVNYSITLPDNFQITIGNANGNITVRTVTNGVVVSCANGTVVGEGIEGNTIMNVANGSIDTAVTLPAGAGVALDVANGYIHLEIPRETSAQFTATVANGQIGVDNLTLSNMVTTPTKVTGTLGDGDGSIVLGVANGDITVEGF